MSTTRRYTFLPLNQGASIGHGPNGALTGRYGQTVSLTDRAAYLVVSGFDGEGGAPPLVANVGDGAEQAASQAILDAIAGGATYAPSAPLDASELAAVRAMDDADVDGLSAASVAAIETMIAAGVDDLTQGDVGDLRAAVSAGIGNLTAVEVTALRSSGIEGGDTLALTSDLAGAGGFSYPPDDWRADPSAVGIGTDAPLLLGDYPDLADADAGVALASAPAISGGGKLTIEPTPGTAATTPAGVPIASVAAGDYTVIADLAHVFTGDATAEAADSVHWEMGLVGFTGTDTQTASFTGAVVGRALDKAPTGFVAKWNDNGTGGRDVANVVTAQDYALSPGRTISLAVVRTGNLVKSYYGNGEAWDLIGVEDEGSAPAGIVALMCSCQTAAASLKVGLRNKLVLDNGAAGAGELPDW